MDTSLIERALAWIAQDPDLATRQELQALIDDESEAELGDRLAGPLEFGTAGLRGIIGAGETRMNRAVVLRTTAGLATYLLAQVDDVKTRGVVVGYDGRRFSRVFAEDTAAVLAAHGIRVWLTPDVVPTPLVAYGVRALGAAAGIMVTASHNPPEYNGYKVYWGDGAQIVPPHDAGIAAAIAAQPGALDVARAAPGDARVLALGGEISGGYLDSVKRLSVSSAGREKLRIVYTPLHGVGDVLARRALSLFGFRDVVSVPEQQHPDGNFPTVSFPNPEEKGALDLAFALAQENGANLVLANDPDADRLAVAVPWPPDAPQAPGFRQLSGNEVGTLLADHLLRHSTGADRLVVTTLVSSPMLGQMAKRDGVRYAETLTGFKWIAAAAVAAERASGARFLFGYEEALGYAVGPAVRDKDGISAAAVFAELTAIAASEGRSLHDELERIARRYGLFVSRQHNITRKGAEGKQAIEALMDRLRRDPPTAVAGHAVTAVRDLLAAVPSGSGESPEALSMPPSNVLVFALGDAVRIIARPSGTEPKVKFYFDLREDVQEAEPFPAANARALGRLDALVAAFVRDVATPALPS